MKLLAVFITFFLVSCDDRYRYPCQDPENFNKEKCKPPACIADGTCTDFLVGRDTEIRGGDNSWTNVDGNCGRSVVFTSICDTAR